LKSKLYLFVILAFCLLISHDLINRESNIGKSLLVFNYLLVAGLLINASLSLKNFRLKYIFYALFLIISLLSIRTDDFGTTFNFIFRVFLGLSFLFIGVHVSFHVALNKFFKLFIYTLILFPLYIVASNVLNFGESVYGEKGLINSGFLTGARLYFFSFMITLSPFFLKHVKKEKYFKYIKGFVIIISAIASMLFILLIFRRTAIIIFTLGLLIYSVKNLRKNLPAIFAFGAITITALIMNISLVTEAAERRGGADRLGVQNLENEKRYSELSLIYNRLEGDLSEFLFGTGNLFNDRGDYGGVSWSEQRRIHGDIAAFFYGTGLLGTTIYIIYLLAIFKLFLKSFSKESEYQFLKYFIPIVFAITSFTGGVYYFTYCAFMFFIIGYMIGSAKHSKIRLVNYSF
jgi:hypothetical protein